MNIIIAVLIFGLIVLIHEFGHFITAKKFGITVLEFSIGMGPKIYSWTSHNTIFSIRALPIGGYCSMLGENEEEVMPGEVSFVSRPVWQRFLVLFCGPFFNFVLAFFMAIILVSNVGIDRCVLSGVMPGYPAEQAGLKAGDLITKIDSEKVTIYRDLTLYTYMNPGKTVNLTVKRASAENPAKSETLKFTVTPQKSEEYHAFMLGIQVGGYEREKLSIADTIYYSAYEVYFNIHSAVKGLAMLIGRKISPDNLSGPVGIVNMIGQTVNESKPYGISVVFLSIVNMVLLLSANLGIMNLLPLPALDGGRLIFLIIEGILGHPINRKFEGYVHMAGFVILMILMVIVMFNDIRNII